MCCCRAAQKVEGGNDYVSINASPLKTADSSVLSKPSTDRGASKEFLARARADAHALEERQGKLAAMLKVRAVRERRGAAAVQDTQEGGT